MLALQPVISDLGTPGRALVSRGSLGSPRAAIFSRRGGREGTIYRSNSPRSLRQWNPACVTRADIPGPPLAPPPRAPRPAPPPAGTAPPPAPLYGQGSPAVRQRRPRPSACVTERLRGGSAAPGSPSGGGCESPGSVRDGRSALGGRQRLGVLVPGWGSRSRPGRCPRGERAAHPSSLSWFFGMLHEGDGCTRGWKGCCRVVMPGHGCRVQLWSCRGAVGTEQGPRLD